MRCILQIIRISSKFPTFQRPLWSVSAKRFLHVTSTANSPRFQSRNDGPTTAKEDDIKTLEDIEKGLFDSPKYRPTVEIRSKIEPNVLRFEQKAPAANKPKKSVPAPQASDNEYRFDEKLGLKYQQMDRRDKRLSSIMAQVRSKSEPKILLEGIRLIDDALDAGLQLKTLIFSRFEQVHRIRNQLAVMEQEGSKHELIRIENSDMKFWSDLTTSPGIIGIFKKPTKSLSFDESDLPITVICDQVREPNNLGSIIRVASSIPCQQVICVKGTADPWSSKSLRGGAGGHFRIPIRQMDWPQIEAALPKNCQFFIADNHANRAKSCAYDQLDLDGLELAADSIEEKSHIVVVVGGETHGVSRHAMAYNPVSINIPLAHRMESLNCCSAVSVILFEMRRKLLALQGDRYGLVDINSRQN